MHVTKFLENSRKYTRENWGKFLWDITENFIEHSPRPIQEISPRHTGEKFWRKKNSSRHNRENSEKFGWDISDEFRGNPPEHIYEDSEKIFTETQPRISRKSFVDTLQRKFPKNFADAYPPKIKRNFAEANERIFRGNSTIHTGENCESHQRRCIFQIFVLKKYLFW